MWGEVGRIGWGDISYQQRIFGDQDTENLNYSEILRLIIRIVFIDVKSIQILSTQYSALPKESRAAMPTDDNHLLEHVFVTTGVPQLTFVEPDEFDRLKLMLRDNSRPVVVEGPSGIGKTTSVKIALKAVGKLESVSILNARNPNDVEYIQAIPQMDNAGTVMIDDFHMLDSDLRKRVSDYIKFCTETEADTKIIILGINEVGQSILSLSPDLALRIDRMKMQINSGAKIRELIEKGEAALNLSFGNVDKIVSESLGSFQICQLVCKEICLNNRMSQTATDKTTIDFDPIEIRGRILDQISPIWSPLARQFSRGPRFRPGGRAPYLQVLKWLGEGKEWSLDVGRAVHKHVEHKGSVGQILEKGWLDKFYNDNSKNLSSFIHFDPDTKVLSVEDPKAFYYLRHILWGAFARQCGFTSEEFQTKYDFAISFAGAQRSHARQLSEHLQAAECSVFFDENEQAEMLGQNLEKYLGPIYESEAEYIITILSKEYPTRIWTKFESENFKSRFGEGKVIPIVMQGFQPSMFDETYKIGSIYAEDKWDENLFGRKVSEKLIHRLEKERARA